MAQEWIFGRLICIDVITIKSKNAFCIISTKKILSPLTHLDVKSLYINFIYFTIRISGNIFPTTHKHFHIPHTST